MHSITPDSPVRSNVGMQSESIAAGQVDRLRAAIIDVDVVRIDLRDREPDDRAVANLITELSQPGFPARPLKARIPLTCCQSAVAALLMKAADFVEVWVPHLAAASAAADRNSPELLTFVNSVKLAGKASPRVTFEVSQRTAGRLSRLVEIAAEAGFGSVCFEPLFIADEREIAISVFFDQAAYNRDLDEGLKTGKRHDMFVDAVKFGSQGQATEGIAGRKRELVIRFERDGKRSVDWCVAGGAGPIRARIADVDITAAELAFRHMDHDKSHFDRSVLNSPAYQARKAQHSWDRRFVEEFGPLFARYDLDCALYVNSIRSLGIAPPQLTNQDDPIGLLNAAIESNFTRAGGSNSRKAVIGLTKPFIGINWGAAQQHLLPDQRQFWRTFNQWQVPTVFVAVEPGHDYRVRTVIHNATPGDAIEYLQLSCNGYVPPGQIVDWEGGTCLHVCTIPARVLNDAAGKLCLSFGIMRQAETGPPAEIGLRSISIAAVSAADSPDVPNGTAIRRALLHLRSMIKLKPWLAPGEAERRAGFGRPVSSADFADLAPYRVQAATIAAVRHYETLVEGQEETVAAFALLVADLVKRGDVNLAVDRALAQTKEIVNRRLDWIKFSKVEHRYLDTSVTYEFFSILRIMLGDLLPTASVLSLFEAVAKKNPTLRPALLAIADWYLEAGRYDEAIEAARLAARHDACCLISQDVLRKVYRAKFPNSKDSVIDGVPLYDLSDRFCSVPFDRIETAKDGIVWTCCPAWLGAPIGNMHIMEWEAAWNSDQAGLMRESILDGSFKYCNSGVCPAILAGNLPKKSEVSDLHFRHYIDNNVVKIPDGPREISISHDPSCNLACPQCRQDFILSDDAKNAEFKETIDSFIKPLIEFAEIDRSTILMSGDGEIFVSPHYREVLKLFDPEKHSHVGINLLSNGLVFESGWKKVPNIHKLVSSVTISTDGASEEVYRVTRGGSWKKLYRNLQYISELRKTEKIKKFGIHYAVQTCNYKDMKRMVEIGLKLHVDRIAFAILRNGGVYDPAEYATRCIFQPSHPDHATFVKELEDPIFGSPIVDISQFIGFRGDAVVN